MKDVDSTTADDTGPGVEARVTRLADAVRKHELTVAAAESLTGGSLSAALAAGPDASDWYQGAVVAYNPEVKTSLLHVAPGPVITAACAAQMATGVAALLHAEIAVATTGAGGPDPEEGHEAGTVFIATVSSGTMRVTEHHFSGDPSTVVHRTTLAALEQLLELTTEATQDESTAGGRRTLR